MLITLFLDANVTHQLFIFLLDLQQLLVFFVSHDLVHYLRTVRKLLHQELKTNLNLVLVRTLLSEVLVKHLKLLDKLCHAFKFSLL